MTLRVAPGDKPFCSVLTRAEREPPAGTASHARGCVLLTYPKRLWGRDALDSEGLPPGVKAGLEHLREEHDVLTRFVAHDGDWLGRTEVTFFPIGRRFRDVALDDVPKLLARAAEGGLRDAEGGRFGEPVTAPMVLVCTHGQRDRCCALFGLAMLAALRELEPARVEVREASHLGGDRFAPTALVFPSGHMYGHLDPEDAPALLLAAQGGAPLLAKLRGSLFLTPLEQLGEIAALGLAEREGAAPKLGPIEVVSKDAREGVLRVQLPFGDQPRILEVRCRFEQRQVIGDCRSAERGRRGGVGVWTVASTRTLQSVPPT